MTMPKTRYGTGSRPQSALRRRPRERAPGNGARREAGKREAPLVRRWSARCRCSVQPGRIRWRRRRVGRGGSMRAPGCGWPDRSELRPALNRCSSSPACARRGLLSAPGWVSDGPVRNPGACRPAATDARPSGPLETGVVAAAGPGRAIPEVRTPSPGEGLLALSDFKTVVWASVRVRPPFAHPSPGRLSAAGTRPALRRGPGPGSQAPAGRCRSPWR